MLNLHIAALMGALSSEKKLVECLLRVQCSSDHICLPFLPLIIDFCSQETAFEIEKILNPRKILNKNLNYMNSYYQIPLNTI